jgi:metallo-beta-lactamase family protein
MISSNKNEKVKQNLKEEEKEEDFKEEEELIPEECDEEEKVNEDEEPTEEEKQTVKKTTITYRQLKKFHREEVANFKKQLTKMKKPEIFKHHAEISFYGGSGTVTGSKHFVSYGRLNVLVDCGMFQGLKDLRLRNWSMISSSKPVELITDAIIITHAHLDHVVSFIFSFIHSFYFI